MLTFEQTMALGEIEYRDVIDLLAQAGLPTRFTQTGGMNAALEVVLDSGHSLLITDAEDSLSWTLKERQGWGVGLYGRESEYDGDCLAWASTLENSTTALVELIKRVLRAAVNQD